MTLICSVCGSYAKAKKQWWNRDKGYGLCADCANDMKKSTTTEDIKNCWGIEGVHYFTKEEVQS